MQMQPPRRRDAEEDAEKREELATETQRHRDTETPRHRDTEAASYSRAAAGCENSIMNRFPLAPHAAWQAGSPSVSLCLCGSVANLSSPLSAAVSASLRLGGCIYRLRAEPTPG